MADQREAYSREEKIAEQSEACVPRGARVFPFH